MDTNKKEKLRAEIEEEFDNYYSNPPKIDSKTKNKMLDQAVRHAMNMAEFYKKIGRGDSPNKWTIKAGKYKMIGLYNV